MLDVQNNRTVIRIISMEIVGVFFALLGGEVHEVVITNCFAIVHIYFISKYY